MSTLEFPAFQLTDVSKWADATTVVLTLKRGEQKKKRLFHPNVTVFALPLKRAALGAMLKEAGAAVASDKRLTAVKIVDRSVVTFGRNPAGRLTYDFKVPVEKGALDLRCVQVFIPTADALWSATLTCAVAESEAVSPAFEALLSGLVFRPSSAPKTKPGR